MSVAPRNARPSHALLALGAGPITGLGGVRMTADEFLALGETDERYELFDGVVVMSPSPFPLHNEIAAEVVFQLKAFQRSGGAVRVFPETDVSVGGDVVLRPDIVVYPASAFRAAPRRFTTPPDLIVEVLSASTRGTDLLAKRDAYERFGVPEYWAIDPGEHEGGAAPAAGPLARCYRRQGPRLVEVPVEGDTLPSVALPGFTLDLRPIRALARAQG